MARRPALLIFVLISMLVLMSMAMFVSTAGPARAQDASYAETFLRAERSERMLGDLEGAAGLYAKAAELAGDDVGRKARADVRAGTCLRRLGRQKDARPLLEAWTQPVEGVPDELRQVAAAELAALGDAPVQPELEPGPEAPSPEDMERQIAELRRENSNLGRRLRRALERFDEAEIHGMLEQLRVQTEQLAELRAELDRYSPETAAEALELRRSELRERSLVFAELARRHYRAGRFEDARAFCRDALELDRDNASAQGLLTHISAPLGVRERLFEEILGAVALAHEVQVGRIAAEIASLTEEGGRRQRERDYLGSIEPLERALALVNATDGKRAPEEVRAGILAMLRTAEREGASRRPVAAPDLPKADPAWLEGTRKLLAFAGSEVSGGLELRVHDLDRVLGLAASGLPPVGPRPVGWTLSADRIAGADLLTAYLASNESRGLGIPGAGMRVVGRSAVTLAPREAQQRIHDSLAALATNPGGAVEVEVTARRGAPGEWEAWLTARGLRSDALPGGARFALIPAGAFRGIEGALSSGQRAVFASAGLDAAPLRAFRLETGTSVASVTTRVLPIGGKAPGVGVHVAVQWRPGARADAAPLVQQALAGGRLEAGGGLVVFGLADPASPERELAAVVRLGTPTAAPGAAPPKPGPDAPPAPRGDVSAAEYELPATVRGLHDVGPSAIHVPDHPVPSREDGLRRRLEVLREVATVLEPREDRIVVVAPPETHRAVLALLERVGTPGLHAFDVAMLRVTAADERRLVDLVKSFSPSDGGFFWAVVRRPAQERLVENLLRAVGSPVPLVEPRVSAPPTGRADVARVVRSVYRRELEVRERPEPAWGRSETAWVDEGVLLTLRPFGLTPNGRVDLDLSLRAAFVSDRGARSEESPLGTITALRPRLSTVWGDVSVRARPGETIVLAGLPSPFPGPGGRDRLVVLVKPVK